MQDQRLRVWTSPPARSSGPGPVREPGRRHHREAGDTSVPVPGTFALLVGPAAPEPLACRQQPPGASMGPGVELVQAASSRDGVHLASLKVQTREGGELGLRVLMNGDAVDVRIDVSGVQGESWVRSRVEAIEQAVASTGLSLANLDIGQRGGRAPEDGGEDPQDRGPAGRARRSAGRMVADGGWTL